MTSYKNDIPEGPWVIWYPNDIQIKEQGFNLNGKRSGLTTYWYSDSVKQKEGYYSNGKPDAVWSYWNTRGEKDFDFDFGKNLEQIEIAQINEVEGFFYKLGDEAPFTGVIVDDIETAGYLFLGAVKDGQKDGPWIKWYPGGKKVPEVTITEIPEPEPFKPWSGNKEEQGSYKNGKKHGEWTEWFGNEHVKSHGEYNEGVMIGEWTFWYDNGAIEKKGLLENGNAHGVWDFWNRDGRKIQQGSFSNGIKNGQWVAWFEDGRTTEGYYSNGKKHDIWISWWDAEHRKKEMQGTYREGKMVDKWYFYNADGNLKEVRYFSPSFK